MRPVVAGIAGVILGSTTTLLIMRVFVAAGPPLDRQSCGPNRGEATGTLVRQQSGGHGPERDGALTHEAPSDESKRGLLLARELTARAESLQAELKHAKQEQSDSKAYDLSVEKLEEMAAHCELRWDMPSLGPLAPTVTPESIQALGLTDDEQKSVNTIFKSAHQQLLDWVTKAYSETVGVDPDGANINGTAMFQEILDKTDRTTIQTIFQRLSRERAGLAEPPNQPPASQVEVLLRAMTSAGGELEAELGAKLGSSRAHRYRDLNRGWDSQHRSSYGCPP